MNVYTFMNPVGLAACSGSLKSFYMPWMGLGHGMGDDALTIAAQADPEPYSKAALTIISTIENFFGFGSGRREANEITPVQNKVVDDIIAPISAQLNSSNAAQISVQQWQDMLSAVQKTETAWLGFLHNTTWSDGRAATQAEQTLASYFAGEIDQLQKRILTAPNSITQSIIGVPSGVYSDPGIPGHPLNLTTPSSTSSILTMGASTLIPVVIGGIALWYFLGRGKKGMA